MQSRIGKRSAIANEVAGALQLTMSVAASLANITLNQLNFTANCSNLALGLYVFENDFNFQTPNSGNYSYDNSSYYNSSVDDGPSDYFEDFWTNGTSPEWISFWRYTLSSVLPTEYLSLSDGDIARWANTTVGRLSERTPPLSALLFGLKDAILMKKLQEAFNFFDNDVDSIPAPDSLSELSYDLAESGGCRQNASTNIEDIVGYEQACMVQYCCSSALNSSVSRNPNGNFTWNTAWTIEDACAFNTCQQSNTGNPDLGGIGVCFFFPRHVEEKIILIDFYQVIVAYFIEASLLALSLVRTFRSNSFLFDSKIGSIPSSCWRKWLPCSFKLFSRLGEIHVIVAIGNMCSPKSPLFWALIQKDRH